MPALAAVSNGQLSDASQLNQYRSLFNGGLVYDAVGTYGALGNGTGDDRAAIQSAIDACVSAGGGTVLLRPGTYNLGGTLNVTVISNFKLVGLGSTGASDLVKLKWNGTTGGTVLYIDRVRDSVFEGFSVINGNNTFGVGIDLDETSLTPIITSCLEFHNIDVDGGTVAGVRGGPNTTNNNNDLHRFWNVHFYNSGGGAGPGVKMDNPNAKGWQFYGCNFNHRTYGIQEVRGSFHLFGTSFETNSLADIYLTNTVDTITMTGLQSEGSNRFLETGPNGGPFSVTVTGSRIAANGLNADGKMIKFGFAGPISLINNDFAQNSYIAGFIAEFIGGSATARQCVFNLIGNVFPNNTFLSSTSAAVGMVANNRYIDSGSNYALLDDFYGPYGATTTKSNYTVGKHMVLQADLIHSRQAPSFVSTYAPDPTLGEYVAMTLTGAITVSPPVASVTGQTLTFIWTQDGTGGRVVSYNAVYKTTGTGATTAFVTTASTVTIDSFVCVDGTNWRLVSRITGQT